MKSLDEVIVGLGICARELDCNCCREAVHYLKQFASQNSQKMVNKSDSISKMEYNDPLTWEQLEEMNGKPVWVELTRSGLEAWGLSDGIYVDAFGHDIITIKVLHDLWHLDKEQIGQSWKAYRKPTERDGNE